VEVVAGIFMNHISWTNASNPDLRAVEVLVHTADDWTEAEVVAVVTVLPEHYGKDSSFDHHVSNITQDYFYWVRSVDYAGNKSVVAPLDSGVSAPGEDTISEAITKIMESLDPYNAPEWVSGADYEAGNVVEYANRQWECVLAVSGGTTPPPDDATHWQRTGILIQGDVDGVPTVGVDGNLVADGTILARSIATDQLQVGSNIAVQDGAIQISHFNTSQRADILNKYAPARGEGQNVNNWQTFLTGDSEHQYIAQINIMRDLDQLWITLDSNADTYGDGFALGFEIEVFGTTITGASPNFVIVDSYNASFYATVGSDTSFGATLSLAGVTETVGFRIKLTTFETDSGEGSASNKKRSVAMGDRFVAHNPEIPWTAYFAAVDSEQYDVLLMQNGPAEPGADVTGDHTAKDIINLPDTPDGAPGLFCSGTHIGYHDGGSWQVCIQSDGDFHFSGDADNYIQWTGTTLGIKGHVNIQNPDDVKNNQLDVDKTEDAMIDGTPLFNVDGLITADFLLVGTAQIENLAVDTLKIAGEAVETLKIKADDVSVVEYAEAHPGLIASTWTDLFPSSPPTISVNGAHDPKITFYAFATINNNSANLAEGEMRVLRNGSSRAYISQAVGEHESSQFVLCYTETIPTTGSYDYTIEVKCNENADCPRASLNVFSAKR
jgi:hypothetical protein